MNGTGLARDLSLRGLRVILLERNDLAFGASGNSSGMIHGGPRYLTTHPAVTRSSCVDSGYIQTIAPHMIFRTPFVMPVYGHGPVAKVRFDAYDAFFALYDDYQPLKRGKPHTRLTPAETLALVPGLRESDLYGAVTFDEWGIDGNRLCVANAIDAVEHGAGSTCTPASSASSSRRAAPPASPRATASRAGVRVQRPRRGQLHRRVEPHHRGHGGRRAARAGAPRQGGAPRPGPVHHRHRGDGRRHRRPADLHEPWGTPPSSAPPTTTPTATSTTSR